MSERDNQVLLLYLMRVLFWKIHFSFICFCKPSSQLYTPSPLELENKAQSSSKANGICNVNDNHTSENVLKSSLKKATPESSVLEKKKVQWVDLFGEQLVEIKEFEPSEDEDTEYERVRNRHCICNIL